MTYVNGIKRTPKDAQCGHELLAYVAVAENNVLTGGETLETNRTSGMKLICRYPYLGAQPILETVCEAGRCVYHDRAGIDLSQKTHCNRVILRHDTFRMA